METHRKAYNPRPVSGVGRVLLALVRGYQCAISPLLGQHCRFEPSCSHYAMEAIQLWGVLKGSGLTMSRICRCHPWGGTGYDPVPCPPLSNSMSDR